MAEEAVAEATEETTETTEAVSEEVSSAESTTEETVSEEVSETSSSDWRDTIADGDARKHAERFTSLDDMAKALLDGRKQLSKAIQVPRANAKDEDVAAFRKALGVPERASDYEYTPPEGLTEEILQSEEVQARLQGLAEVAHNKNVSSEAFEAIMEWHFKEAADLKEARIKEDEAFAEASTQVLKDKWGPQYDKELAFANRGSQWAADANHEDFRELQDKAGNLIADHPIMVEMMNKVGRAMSEDGVGSFPIDAETATTLREELNTLTEKQDEHMRKGEHSAAQTIDLKIMELSRKIGGDEPIVGA